MLGKDFFIGMLLPLGYITVLLGSLITFSTLYRKRKAIKSASLEPWFPPHLQRNIYLSLLHLEAPAGAEKAPAVPDSVLRAALLRRAVEDIHRIVKIRTAKNACTSLLAQGKVGDDLMLRFQRAEQEMEAELKDVVTEANALAPNWGQVIFQSANEVAANTMFRERLDQIHSKVEAEKEWWEQRRASIKDDFMKELDADANPADKVGAAKAGSDEDDSVLVDVPTSTEQGAGKKKKGKK